MVKQKQPSKMKTSEIINELYDFEDEKRGDELDEEFNSRYPFNYFKDRFEELDSQIKILNKLLSHRHKDGKVLIEI